MLRSRGIGRLIIKKRHFPKEPPAVHKELGLKGNGAEGTLSWSAPARAFWRSFANLSPSLRYNRVMLTPPPTPSPRGRGGAGKGEPEEETSGISLLPLSLWGRGLGEGLNYAYF